MKHPKLRFMHEKWSQELGHMPPQQILDQALRSYDAELQTMILAHKRGLMGAFDVKQRAGVNGSLSLLSVLLVHSFSRPDFLVRRYLVTEGLERALRETEPPSEGFSASELRLPVPAVVIRWPNGEECYAITMATFQAEVDRHLDIEVSWQLMEDGKNHDDEKIFFLQAAPGGSYMQGMASWYGFVGESDFPETSPAEDMDEARERQAMLVNLLAYLTLARPDAIETNFRSAKKQGEVLSGKKRNSKHFNYVHLGTRTYYLSDDQLANAAGRSFEHRHRVCGHWKMQPFGEGRKQRRRIWIMPYMRGPKDADTVERVRILDW